MSLKKYEKLTLSILLFSTMCMCTACRQSLDCELVITNVNVIDVESGAIHYEMDVAIRADSILSISKNKTFDFNLVETIIGNEQFLIPGLWDMHTHASLNFQDYLLLLVANGVTGIREMQDNFGITAEFLKKEKSDSLLIPEIVTSGALVDGYPSNRPNSEVARTPEEGRQIVRKQKSAGVDFIKVYSKLKRDVYLAIADESKKQDIPFSGHIPRSVTLEDAVAAKQRSIEHFSNILEYTSSKKGYLDSIIYGTIKNDIRQKYSMSRRAFLVETFDENRTKELNKLITDGETWICPTSVTNRMFGYINDSSFTNDPRVYYLPSAWGSNFKISQHSYFKTLSDEDFQIERNWYHLGLSVMNKMPRNKFLAGTDIGMIYIFPGFSLHDELQIFVEDAGFTPLEALQTATINPVIFLGIERKIGTIEKGKLANMVLLSSNPLEDINNTRKINGVFLRGKYHDSHTLKLRTDKIARWNKLPNITEVIEPIILKEGVDAGIEKYLELRESSPEKYKFDNLQLNYLGYSLLRLEKPLDAVKIFKLNVKIFPKDGNLFNSLSDGYFALEETEKAIQAMKKAQSFGYKLSMEKQKMVLNE
ncbi:MAG: amidohydrolase family protein [Bacteroidota bacterium]